jgi:hypothetical protein
LILILLIAIFSFLFLIFFQFHPPSLYYI